MCSRLPWKLLQPILIPDTFVFVDLETTQSEYQINQNCSRLISTLCRSRTTRMIDVNLQRGHKHKGGCREELWEVPWSRLWGESKVDLIRDSPGFVPVQIQKIRVRYNCICRLYAPESVVFFLCFRVLQHAFMCRRVRCAFVSRAFSMDLWRGPAVSGVDSPLISHQTERRCRYGV